MAAKKTPAPMTLKEADEATVKLVEGKLDGYAPMLQSVNGKWVATYYSNKTHHLRRVLVGLVATS